MSAEMLGIYICPTCRTPINREADGLVEKHDVLVHRFFFKDFVSKPCPGTGKVPLFIQSSDYLNNLKERSKVKR